MTKALVLVSCLWFGLMPFLVNLLFSPSLSVILYPNMKTVLLEEVVFLECILAGYIPGNKDIQWFFNGEMLRNSEKYTIFDSSDAVCAYGTCRHSQLLIRLPNANDVGTYTCSYENLSERISVVTSKHLQ